MPAALAVQLVHLADAALLQCLYAMLHFGIHPAPLISFAAPA